MTHFGALGTGENQDTNGKINMEPAQNHPDYDSGTSMVGVGCCSFIHTLMLEHSAILFVSAKHQK